VSRPHWEGVETEHGIDDELTATDAAHLLGIDPAHIRVWANRGDIEKRTAPDGTPVYLLRDIIEREAKTRRKRMARHQSRTLLR
jgi:hypothetical protein